MATLLKGEDKNGKSIICEWLLKQEGLLSHGTCMHVELLLINVTDDFLHLTEIATVSAKDEPRV